MHFLAVMKWLPVFKNAKPSKFYYLKLVHVTYMGLFSNLQMYLIHQLYELNQHIIFGTKRICAKTYFKRLCR